MSTQLDPLSLAGDLLYAVKTEGEPEGGLGTATGADTRPGGAAEARYEGDVAHLRERLATLGRSRLTRELSTRERKLSFWLNCYNAYAQLRLEEEPDVLEGGLLERWKFFCRDRVPVAGAWLSLNDIEHGLLRSSKHPWGLGYLPRPFPSSFEREFRLEQCDPRIHFALCRGAENSPPIAIYSPDDVDEHLDIAIEWFLEENAEYDPDANRVTIPRFFRRYRGDFGGKRGIVEFLRRYNAIPGDATPSIECEASARAPDFDIEVDRDELHELRR
ncbi:DUF547 domain-containing protein [Halobiforma lacisalsi AJ5]|uniref:DUF547 domain-containing protein n=1 Tax=Natronobacterium lacisalsi AJ5 TaxID=358396 RepID=M0LI39_NATLA|nr:DUF547 domain-containing protein [Halobiforma lacisalsi]APW96639.1 DUF547 domain-containing protein [Halobiforma lacisalsi AJ5]EMA32079.1 hypothetical protein C445_12231 [Halobiforma lacisalsi AJ5]